MQPHRRLGLGKIAALMLIADGHVDRDAAVVVFSPHYKALAIDVGCRDVRLFERRENDWVAIGGL